MRLARPVYESLPYVYMAIGGLAIFLFYADSVGRPARGRRIRHRCGCRDGGADPASATPGLS